MVLLRGLFLFSCFLFSYNSLSSDFNIRYGVIDNVKEEKLNNGEYKVLYFFSYGCQYCYDFENYKQHFVNNKSKNILFEHNPLTVIPSWNEYTKAFFIAKSLKLDIRKKIFKQVHIDKKKILTKKHLFEFFNLNYNINNQDFEKRYNSMLLNFKEKKSENLADKYGITGTPAIVVINEHGKVFKTSPSISGGIQDMMATTIYLITESEKN